MHTGDRILSLDALRGFAVMGILLMNITAFALPDSAYFNPRAWGGTGPADLLAWTAAFVLVDGKMRGLFSLLFGASMLLIIDRAEMSGRDGRRVHLVRSAWLFLIGLAHYLLLWWGDILMLYAIIGCIALLFVGHDPMGLVKWAFGCFAAHFLLMLMIVASLHGMRHAAMQPDAGADVITAFRETLATLGEPGTPQIAHSLATYRAGFGTVIGHHAATLMDHLHLLLYFGLDTLGFMLLGMAMLKGGFLTGGWDADQYRRTARHCLVIGLVPMILIAAWLLWQGFPTLATFDAVMTWSFPFRIPLTVGYAALFLTVILRRRGSALIDRVAATGRMALSNYLGTSLLMCALFYGWGLGLFGHVGRAAIYLFVPAVWAVMLLWSKPWLDRFAYGPVEWLWRSLSRGEMQKMRKSVPS
ncbi:MAG: hypothetical protein DI547_10210 [Sphingobium sp.]|nr:MAG: hypothetical protein DI547_10210 [Sphingobium sp.]